MRAQGPFLLCVAVSAACGSPPAGARSANDNASRRAAAGVQLSDSIAISRRLTSAHCVARRVVPGDLRRFAILTQPSSQCGLGRFLLARLVGDSVFLDDRTRDVGGEEPSRMEWTALAHLNGRAVQVSVDEPAEGRVWTTVFGDTGTGLAIIFSDQPRVCAPAELRDVDGDGDAELQSYEDDPASGDCAEPCHEEISSRFGIIPAWVRIQNWNGRSWVGTETKHVTFYRALAKSYRAVDAWLKENGDSMPCAGVYWLRDASLFRRWAARSVSLGEASKK